MPLSSASTAATAAAVARLSSGRLVARSAVPTRITKARLLHPVATLTACDNLRTIRQLTTQAGSSPPTPTPTPTPTSPSSSLSSSTTATTTADEEPALIQAFRTHLKSALRARDKPKLAAVRELLAEWTNHGKLGGGSAKNKIPAAEEGAAVKASAVDIAAERVVRKVLRRMEGSAEEFRAAGRVDLAEKEEGGKVVLEGILKEVLGEEAVEAVRAQIQAKKTKQGKRAN